MAGIGALDRIVYAIRFAHEYENGASIRQIALKHRLSYSTVRKILHETNVELRGVGRYRK